jgi:hypothetical protein
VTATAAAASAKEWAAAFTGPSPIALPLRRVDLARLFAEWGFTKGAEIGVERGHYSETLCQANPELKLLCVDAWKAYRHYREHVSQDKLDGFYTAAVQRLKPYRCQIRRGWSVVEARRVPNHSLDFVYIDGNHKYWHVLCDIEAWAPKVRPGGVISGHDYGRASVGQVKEAVEHWTSTHAIGTWFVLAGDRSPSWFWVRA